MSDATHLRTMHPASREREQLEKKHPGLGPDVGSISPAEWSVLRVLWTEESATARRLSDLLLNQRGWSGSTVKTLLARLEKKGIVRAQKAEHTRGYVYRPLIDEKTAAIGRADAVFDDTCAMQRGQVLLHLVSRLQLSQADIAALEQELEKKKADAPKSIRCDCEKGCED
jgi:CopY/TcrY family copper transport repressor